jgi:hypothetical protein
MKQLLAFFLSTAFASATSLPRGSIEQMAKDSDIAALITVESIHDSNEMPTELKHPERYQAKRAVLHLNWIMKGDPSLTTLEIIYFERKRTEGVSWTSGAPLLIELKQSAPGEMPHVVVFLKRRSDGMYIPTTKEAAARLSAMELSP